MSMGVEKDSKRGQILKIGENVTLFFEGGTSAPAPQHRSIQLEINPEVEGGQKLRGRFTIDGQKGGTTLVGCVAIENYATIPQSDPWGFSGENEPHVNQSIVVTLGKGSGTDSGECPNEKLDLRIFGEASRSLEQIAEVAKAGADQEPFYASCKVEQQSGNWPKKVMPPTPECFQVGVVACSVLMVSKKLLWIILKFILDRLFWIKLLSDKST